MFGGGAQLSTGGVKVAVPKQQQLEHLIYRSTGQVRIGGQDRRCWSDVFGGRGHHDTGDQLLLFYPQHHFHDEHLQHGGNLFSSRTDFWPCCLSFVLSEAHLHLLVLLLLLWRYLSQNCHCLPTGCELGREHK